jgi:hypothetical protein
VFLIVLLSSHIGGYDSFGGIYCLHIHFKKGDNVAGYVSGKEVLPGRSMEERERK